MPTPTLIEAPPTRAAARLGRAPALLVALALTAGCGAKADSGGEASGDDTGGAAGDGGAPLTGVGQLALTFAIDSDYAAVMDEPPNGTFYGSFWRGDEVSGVGPDDGAEDLGGVQIDGLSLPLDGSSTAVVFTSGDLPTGEVVLLGFLDSDANTDPADAGPDPKDPVTLPADNDFDVIDGEVTEVRVFFGLLNPTSLSAERP